MVWNSIVLLSLFFFKSWSHDQSSCRNIPQSKAQILEKYVTFTPV